jgi:acyl-CoA thioesterase-1
MALGRIFMYRGSAAFAIALVLFGFSHAQVKVACIGNSITEGTGLASPSTQSYPARLQSLLGTGYTVQNDGVSGKTLLKNSDASYWTQGKLPQVFTFKPDIVTIKLGTNDTKPQNWDAHNTEFKRDFLAMIDTLNTLSTKPRIFLVLPVPIWTNSYGIRDSALQKIMVIIKLIALERGLPVIDCNAPLKPFQSYFSDGVHPNAAGADSIARVIYRSIAGAPAMRFQYCSYTSSEGALPFRLFLPENYSRTQKYPLILALHGAGERGTDNIVQVSLNRVAEVWAEDSTQQKQKCFVVAPQCPSSGKWVNVPQWTDIFYSTQTMAQSDPMTLALKMVDSLIKVYPIDTNRLYLTGLSMGGYGTWDILARHPGKFAAAIPLCGGCDTSKVAVARQTPLWTFHGAQDGTVPPGATRAMMAKIKAAGDSVVQYTAQYATYFANATITRAALTSAIDSGAKKLFCEYTDAQHDIWTKTYNEPLVHRWLFKQVKVPPVTVLSRGPNASNISTLPQLTRVFAGNTVSGIFRRMKPGARYEVRVFDMRGVTISRKIVEGSSAERESGISSLKSTQAIRWVTVRAKE